MNLSLVRITGTFAVCKLSPDEPIPFWVMQGEWWTVSKTLEELSVVCLQEQVPVGVKVEKDWSLLKVAGPLDFALTGILAALAKPLADAGISIFAISTFDTDYLLVKTDTFDAAARTLTAAGFSIT